MKIGCLNTQLTVTANNLIFNYIFIYVIIIVVCNGQDHDGEGKGKSQGTQFLPPPLITVYQQRRNSLQNCSSELDGIDNIEFGGYWSTCYDFIRPNFSLTLNDSILAVVEDRFIIQCSAPYVTRWVVTLLPSKGVTYLESRRENQDPFNTQNVTFYSEFRLIVTSGNSGWVKCQYALNDNKAQTSGVYIFSQSGDDMVDYAKRDLMVNLKRPLEVRCAANRPDILPILQEENDSDEFEEIDPARILKPYDPRYGFVVQGLDKTEQSYKCVTEESEFLHHFKVITSVDQLTDHTSKHAELEEIKIETGLLATGNGVDGGINERLSDVVCQTDKSYTIIFKMIRCTSIFHCDWLSPCFQNCYLKYDVEALEKRTIGKSSTLTNPFFAGLVICYVWLGSKEEKKYFFIGLDRFSYFTDDDEIPKNALILLNTEERDFYTNQSTNFLCEVSTFLLVPNIQFAIVFRNGTVSLLKEGLSSHPFIDYKLSSLTEYESRAFAQRDLRLNLTKEMKEVLCYAPWYNSSEWIKQSVSFRPRDVVLPSIDKSGGKETRTVHSGQKDQLLHCSATGEPKPQLKWIFPDPQIENIIIKSSESKEGESTLTFPNIDNLHIFTGKYTCVATNRFGEDRYIFEVYVQDSRVGAGIISGVCVAIFCFLVAVAGIIYFGCKYRLAANKIRDLTEEEINEFTNGNEAQEEKQKEATSPEKAQSKGFKTSYVIAEEDLVIAKDCILGHGEYGLVYRGIFHGDAVAVKTTKPNADVSYFKALLLELKTMVYIGEHPNVVTFKGAVTARIRERVIYAVLELSPFGNLHSYLRKVGPGFRNLLPNVEGSVATYENIEINSVTQIHMVKWCEQIADGMDYLALKKVCHGDLATRNVLVFKNDVVKITDFGLSKQLYNYANYVKKKDVPLPWRWLAIETIRFMEFSSKSDVWAFGVTMWEIFSMSQVPYPGESHSLEFLDKLQKGMRLKKPIFTPDAVYELMLKCWEEQPDSRPTFAKLAEDLHAILKADNIFINEAVSATTTGSINTKRNTYAQLSLSPSPFSKAGTKKEQLSEPQHQLQRKFSEPIAKPRMFKFISRKISYVNGEVTRL